MLEKLVSLLHRTTSADDEFHDVSSDVTDNETVYRGALYSLCGLDVNLVQPQVFIRVNEEGIAMLDDCESEGDVIPFENLVSVRQHREESIQFVEKTRTSAKEWGLHLDSPENAAQFRNSLMHGLARSCSDVLGKCHVHLAEETHDQENQQSDSIRTFLKIVQRDADLLTLLVFETGLVVEVNRELQLEIVNVTTGEILFFGPYSSGNSWTRHWWRASGVEETLLLVLMRCYRIENNVVKGEAENTSEDGVSWDNLSRLDDEIEESCRRPVDSDLEDDWDGENQVSSSSAEPRHLRSARDLSHKFMEVGVNHSYVCRGNNRGRTRLEVIDNKSNRRAAIDGKKFTYNAEELVPAKGLLRGEDKLVFLNQSDPEAIYELDVEREKVVNRYQTNGVATKLLWQQNRDADETSTFMAGSSNAFYLMDSRIGCRTLTKEYKTQTNFTAAACDGYGHIALGSQDGVIRLYDGMPNDKGEYKVAKTQLSGQVEAIKAVDTLYDGSWVLVTMKSCLELYPTKLRENDKTGFEVRLGTRKPEPLYLQLKPSDIRKYKLGDVDFRPAVFDKDQQAIVTSTGSLAIIWDFNAIKKNGNLTSYSIKPLDDEIQESKTRSDGTVVVAKRNKVELLNTKKKR